MLLAHLLAGLPLLSLASSALEVSDHAGLIRRHQANSSPKFSIDAASAAAAPGTSCDLDFPFGKIDSNDCQDVDAGQPAHMLIYSEAECETAARLHGGNRKLVPIHESDYDNHPNGCSWQPCADDPQAKCFSINDIGDIPKSPKGTPVCQRKLITKGTKDTNDGCPNEYSVIHDFELCKEAAGCINECEDKEIRIGEFDMSQKDYYPLGCFIHNDAERYPTTASPCVAFNEKIPGVTFVPARPKGTPICHAISVGGTGFPWHYKWMTNSSTAGTSSNSSAAAPASLHS